MLLGLIGLTLLAAGCDLTEDDDDTEALIALLSAQTLNVSVACDYGNNGSVDDVAYVSYNATGYLQTAEMHQTSDPNDISTMGISYATENGLLVCSLDYDDDGVADAKRHFTLNPNGTIASIKVDTDNDGDMEQRADYTYDGSNRLATLTIYSGVNADGSGGAMHITRTYAYTGSNVRPATITQTGASSSSVTWAFSYPNATTITATQDNGSEEHSFTYTLSGNTGVIFELLEFMSVLPR